ncbi:MAG: DNA-3-methyladenine glycosylase [Acidobacteriota bacterium]|nr:DNA-3-methyladenine glycosylase [Acidobacteriota bacterium]
MLPESFYSSPTLTVARNLIGKKLMRRYNGQILAGRIVEVEAYHQDGDRAAHSYKGRTQRNRVMFGPPGHLYVYFIYGMHFCMNVVTEAEGIGAAVLIRAVEPLEGLETMRKLRGRKIKQRDLTSGPARCCRAFAVDRTHDGLSLTGSEIWLAEGEPEAGERIETSPRIGISKSADLPWRFILDGNPYLSR